MAYLQWLAVTCSSVQSTTSQVHTAPDLLQAILGTLEVEDMPTAQLDGWSCLNLLTADLAVISPKQWLLLPQSRQSTPEKAEHEGSSTRGSSCYQAKHAAH